MRAVALSQQSSSRPLIGRVAANLDSIIDILDPAEVDSGFEQRVVVLPDRIDERDLRTLRDGCQLTFKPLRMWRARTRLIQPRVDVFSEPKNGDAANTGASLQPHPCPHIRTCISLQPREQLAGNGSLRAHLSMVRASRKRP